jgi:2-polyprenyl-3-methyl-5-hydroxy-6-metoxy-1,4-benzoquinol methylase
VIVRAIGDDVEPVGRCWIDFGCGNGGLVRYLLQHEGVDAAGYEEGAIAARAADLGIPISGRKALGRALWTADIVKAIEVVEHTFNPVDELQTMRTSLRPAGLLFVTTGNARAQTHDPDRWRYVVSGSISRTSSLGRLSAQ